MRKYLLHILGLVVIGTTLYSCKLDKPILPGQPGYTYVAPPGTDPTGTGGTGGTGGTVGTPVDNPALTATWKVTTTTTIEYVDGVAQSSPSPINLFTDVQMDDGTKMATFDGSFVVFDPVSYVLISSNGQLLLQLSADPFERSSNGPIQVLSVTATTMTWLAVDPLVITSQGHKLQSAWGMTFTKQ